MGRMDRVSQVERPGPPAGIRWPGELVELRQGSLSTESPEEGGRGAFPDVISATAEMCITGKAQRNKHPTPKLQPHSLVN